ncbi:26S proteasome non-ATPase regulatory subunit 2-like isoform X1 [Periplaneta americana]|uniref:26S proteasome non-ATPase regulatory subunit 2-like isoform X1 n=1 Tax=Periplaneta americana TaxID=6978 RepID=UPI0037E71F33
MHRKTTKFSANSKFAKKGDMSDDITEDDKRLQEELNMLVEKLTGPDEQLYMPALETLRHLIRTSTTSMTSVPRPLKYLCCHYETLKNVYTNIKDSNTRMFCADVISVLAMSACDSKDVLEQRECLKYCLLGLRTDVGDWGHEYVRQLEGEVVEEWAIMPVEKEGEMKKQLLPLITNIIAFDMTHNAEIQACDLLMEIDQLNILKNHMDTTNYSKVCHYLVSCANYVEGPERTSILEEVLEYYMQFKEYSRALGLSMQLNNLKMIETIFKECKDMAARKQLSFLVGRQQVPLDFNDDNEEETEVIKQVMSNAYNNDHFLSLARELDIMEPKTPNEIYKTWLEGINLRSTFFSDTPVDSARNNLASSFVNAFVNAGFGKDKLVTGEDGKNWIYRNKENGMLSATAALGLIHLWDVDGGLSPIDRYLYSSDDYIKSGALLALGLVNCGVKNECDPAKALLMDYVLHNSCVLRIGAIFGLGLAYAGSYRDDILGLLLPALTDPKSTPEVIGLTAAACGLVAVATCDYDVTSSILQVLFDANEADLGNTHFRFLPLALGLCYLGKKEAIETTSVALEVLADPFKSMAQTMLQICAYAGTGDVLLIQKMLHICSEHYELENSNKEEQSKEEPSQSCCTETKRPLINESTNKSSMQAVATLGVAVIAMGEEIGTEMSTRIFSQLGRYGEPAIRRAVPLGIALCSMSNPQMSVIDVLNKYSHDSDLEVAHNAIFSMGLVGAGTNNARLATMLRHLAQYHSKYPNHLFMVRLAQGLAHLGKGTMSLSPFHSDGQIMNHVAVAGLLVILVAFFDVKNTILGKSHYLLYGLVAAMHPRWLVTLNEKLEPLPVSVRVGQAVDIVGKAGTPKTITGVHTHNTPVLLAVGERAELATEEYIPLTSVMEGFVILRKKTE